MYYVIRKIVEEPFGITAGPFQTIDLAERDIDRQRYGNQMAGVRFEVLYLPQITR